MITFQQQETTEIRNRSRAAWVTFHKYRQELTWLDTDFGFSTQWYHPR